ALTREIDGFERRARRLNHERNGVQRRSDHRGFPGEDERRPGHRFPRLSNPGGPADDHEQIVAQHRWRECKRQHGGGIESIPSRKITIGEQPGNPYPERDGNERRNARDFETEPERKPVDAHRDGYLLWHARYSTTGTSPDSMIRWPEVTRRRPWIRAVATMTRSFGSFSESPITATSRAIPTFIGSMSSTSADSIVPRTSSADREDRLLPRPKRVAISMSVTALTASL